MTANRSSKDSSALQTWSAPGTRAIGVVVGADSDWDASAGTIIYREMSHDQHDEIDTSFTHPASWLADRDASWYGTLGVLAASLAAVAILVFTL